MNIRERIKSEHEKIKNLSDEVINQNLKLLQTDHRIIDFCSDSLDAYEFFDKMENSWMEEEDLRYYYELLGRKPVSWSFNPSNRKRAESLLAILSTF